MYFIYNDSWRYKVADGMTAMLPSSISFGSASICGNMEFIFEYDMTAFDEIFKQFEQVPKMKHDGP